eukprot:5020612-Pyramimonas_sp.AAC.1
MWRCPRRGSQEVVRRSRWGRWTSICLRTRTSSRHRRICLHHLRLLILLLCTALTPQAVLLLRPRSPCQSERDADHPPKSSTCP